MVVKLIPIDILHFRKSVHFDRLTIVMSELIRIKNALFTKSLQHMPKITNAVFKKPISFTLDKKDKLAIIGSSFKTDFLQILTGNYFCYPISGRKFPESLNNTRFKSELLRFVNNGSWGHGAHDSSGGFTHLSSRYEFFKDLEVDELVKDFIANKSYNSNVEYNENKIKNFIRELKLEGLQGNFITTLSNGQFRRVRIAKELYRNPDILCIDDPFLGLDPIASETVSKILKKTASDPNILTTIVIGLRIQDDVPDWIEKVAIVDENGIQKMGNKSDLSKEIAMLKENFKKQHNLLQKRIGENVKLNFVEKDEPTKEKIIEMKNVNIRYKGVPIIKDLNWEVRDGEKWHIRGRNGSGKTTLLSLITLDHPQSWNRSIKVFNVERAPAKVNYFDTNAKIGFTSPELHAIFPKSLSVFDTISTGYIVGSYIPPRNQLTKIQSDKIIKYLDMMGLLDLKHCKFGEIPVSSQKLVLLLRAIINDPKILILDEALSAMTDEDIIKGKCLIDQWKGTVLIIGHVNDEVPKCDKYILVNGARHGVYEIGEC